MLSVKNISLEIDDKKILDDISLEFEKNKIYVITGPNGGGKSSLAKIIMGIYNQNSGEIILDGENIETLSVNERAAKKLGFAFQHSPRFKGITVSRLLDISMRNEENKKDKNQLLYNVGLCSKEYINRDLDSTLSGGELKRIEIATVLARSSKVYIFDEPEAGIDLWSFKRLVEQFRTLHRENEATLVIVSHQERIIELADELIIIDSGKVQKIIKDRNFGLLHDDTCLCDFDEDFICLERQDKLQAHAQEQLHAQDQA
jgi:Fe-S cluster assembly ATP-binding protein